MTQFSFSSSSLRKNHAVSVLGRKVPLNQSKPDDLCAVFCHDVTCWNVRTKTEYYTTFESHIFADKGRAVPHVHTCMHLPLCLCLRVRSCLNPAVRKKEARIKARHK